MLRLSAWRSPVLLDFLAPRLLVPARHYSLKLPIYKIKRDTTILENHGPHAHDKQLPYHNADIYKSILGRVQQALGEEDVEAVKTCWFELKERDLHRHLAPADFARISNLFIAHYIPKNDTDVLDIATRKLIEEVSLAAACSRSPAALAACMNFYISRNEPKIVISLYIRFHKMLGETDDLSVDNGDVDVLDFDVFSFTSSTAARTQSSSTLVPGRVSILLSFVAAQALRDDFAAAFEAYRQTIIRFHDYTVKDYLSHITDDAFRDKLLLWVRRLEIARKVYQGNPLAIQLQQLVAAGGFNTIQNLYNRIRDGLFGANPFIAGDASQLGGTRLVAMSDRIWTAFLTSFLQSRGGHLSADEVWGDVSRCGIKHPVSLWTGLIDSYAESRHMDNALNVWRMMEAKGVKPDALTYRAVISAALEGRQIDEAIRLFRQFQSDLEAMTEPERSLVVYNTYIHGLLAADRLDEALSVLERMEENKKDKRVGPVPDIVSFNTFLAYFGRRMDLKALSIIINRMSIVGLSADVFSYSILLSALLKIGKADATTIVFNLMRKQGLEPNIVVYGTIIVELLREQSEQHVRAVLKILEEMESGKIPFPPTVKIYQAILVELWRDPWLPPKTGIAITRDVVERMKKRKIPLNIPLYHVLIRVALMDEYPNGVTLAMSLYQEMVRRNLAVTSKLIFLLLQELFAKGEYVHAAKVVRDMETFGMKPIPSTAR
ncbi:uncharacterized protein BT62DRAFT_527487 [Guyanagaster necrorhizus]|uniref:Pentatricopeptide repeat-containing protein n=1 Tax=Guyanagaster necrorhizus TaxID=856835 RepID=A0A9P8AY76_9AGAR|nr:uncharacterized protein BT62DRAFT_527487 [Guyanagaster necrorhizus MCA 3950]KAG7450637.1 hypothetical protein BT62DRAFT_527487 [Guyanagaster necrorhizus MCA 3950]